VSAAALIPVSAAGEPLLDRDPDRNFAAARGPVAVIPARAPIERVQLRFYDQFGTFINSVDHAVSADEWKAMQAASPGDTTWARFMWYPVSRAGARLGTGAYVAQGRLWIKDGAFTNGSDGEQVQVKGGSVSLGPLRFGYIRD
jgi:hypothetical protein